MKKALIIIDMQKGFINENTEHLIDKIEEFAIKGNFHYIIGTRYINSELTACYKFEGWKDCMLGSEESHIVTKLSRICDEVVDKNKYSCWNEDFKDILKEEEIDQLVFVGVNTGCCVLASVLNAYDDVYDVVVIKDLCGSTNGLDAHIRGLQVLEDCITKERVITSKEYLQR